MIRPFSEIMQLSFRATQRLCFLALLASFSIGFSPDNSAQNREQKFTAILIWGTDGPKPDDKDFKDVDSGLVEKFKKIFKWKNYYEVRRKDFGLNPGNPHSVNLSEKCQIKLHLTEHEGMEVELVGEGRSVYKGKQSMPLKDLLILAGDDKNATAWFVVLMPQ